MEQQNLVEVLSKANFSAFKLMVAATIEEELYLCLCFDANGTDDQVHVCDV